MHRRGEGLLGAHLTCALLLQGDWFLVASRPPALEAEIVLARHGFRDLRTHLNVDAFERGGARSGAANRAPSSVTRLVQVDDEQVATELVLYRLEKLFSARL